MRYATTVLFLCCLAAILLGASSQDAVQYLLGPDDQIKVWALGMDEIADKTLRLDPAGDIDLPLIGKVHAGGLTVDELKETLSQRFSKDLLDPKVSLQIVEFGSQPVSVMGAVNRPGIHQLNGRKTLIEVLSLAEGLRQDAGPRINISRKIEYGPIPLASAKTDSTGQFSVAEVPVKELLAGVRPADNILISPHDVVTVPLAESVFVIGAVKKPGELALKENPSISVLQALASAEGYGEAPSPQNGRIVRLVPGTADRKEIPVDLTKIQNGKAEDIAMRANDILVIPPSGPKRAATRAIEAAIQTATGMIIWRHP